MKIYLIDFENVKSKGLTGIDSLTEYDRVIIFYSENADTINFEMHQKVLISKAEVEYFKVHVGGKNALDFQLSTLLGYLVSKNYYSHIFVISNDKSFDFLHDFWHGKYIAAPDCIVYRTKTIAQAINYAGGKKQAVADDDSETSDTEVFASAETAAAEENAEKPAAEEVKVTVPDITEAKAVPEKKEAEKKPAAKSAPSADSEKFTEKRAAKPAPKKERSEKNSKKFDKSDDVEFDVTISAEELNALEASFSAYTIIKPEDISAPKQAEKPEENKAEKPVETVKAQPAEDKNAVEKPAADAKQEQSADAKADKPTEIKTEKPKQKPVKEFYPALKETLKNTGLKPTEVNHISQLLINSDTKEEFHNALAKDYKQDATELYKILRPKYLRLKEMYAAEHPEYVSPDTVVVSNEEPAKAEEKTAEQTVEVKAEEVKAEETIAETVAETTAEQAEIKQEEAIAEEKAEVPAEEKPAKAKKTSTKKSAAKTEKSEKAEKEEKPKKTAKADKEEKSAKAEKTDKEEKPKAKKSAKAEKTAEEKPAKAKKTSTKKSAKAEKPAEVPAAAGGDRLAELLDGKCSSEEVELIRQLFREVPSRQQLYIRMIKQFGKKDGCVYYNAIKPEYEALSTAIK